MKKIDIIEYIYGDTRKIGDLIFNGRFPRALDIVEFNSFYYIASKESPEERLVALDRSILLAAIEFGDILAESGVFNIWVNKKTNVDIPSFDGWPEELQNHLKGEYDFYYNKVINPHVIAWCKKYGFPFLEDGRLNIMDDDTLYMGEGLFGIEIDSFVLNLIKLHSNFYRWRYIEYNEMPDYFNEKKWPVKSMANELSSNGSVKYKLCFNETEERFDFNWASDNLFDLLNLQLALLATRRNPDGMNIKRCVKCNDWFEAKHAAQIYCENKRGCNAKAVAQAKWRKNKK